MHDTALLIIDMQRDFCDPAGYAAQAGIDAARLAAPIPVLRALIPPLRAAGVTMIYTREGHRLDLSDCPPYKQARSVAAGAAIGAVGPLGRLLIRGEAGHDIVPELYPEPGDIVIDKPGYCAFHATDLEAILRAQGVSRLLFTGVTTDVCVHSTLRSAVDRGYDCVTIADATACCDDAIQDAMIRVIHGEGGIFGRVTTSADLLKALAAG